MKFTEAQLEIAIIQLLEAEGYPYLAGEAITRQPQDVLIKSDLRAFLAQQYAHLPAGEAITPTEIETVIRQLEAYPTADLYESNKAIMKLVADGFLLKREDRSQKDLYIQLIDYRDLVAFRQPSENGFDRLSLPTIGEEKGEYQTERTSNNIFKIVNQLKISGNDGQNRIPDGILYINGLPLVVFEFKSAIVENATIHDAYKQLTTRYRRDIPELFKYNAFCVISDGGNNKAGSFFAPYEFYYAWRAALTPSPSPKGRGEPKAPLPLGEAGVRAEAGVRGYRGHFNYAGLKEIARELRQKQTPAEEMMWGLLRNRQLANLKFRRQHQIDLYIVDFYCHQLKLVVELDGGYHAEPAQAEKDKERDANLRSMGFEVLRVENKQFMDDPTGVLEQIVPHPQPLSLWERGAFGSSPFGRGGGEGIGIGEGINSLYTMIGGLFNPLTLLDVIRNFIYLPDTSRKDEKILCRYPQYYAATKLYRNIIAHMRPDGDGKGGTYFGATGSGKSYTMLFLTRLLMKSVELASPTIILITDRTDLDDQLSRLFTNGKKYIGDESVISVTSRANLRELLKGRNSGGVFLTTIHKFTEDTELLTTRNNVIVISDEAHRSQVNLDQKVRVTKDGGQAHLRLCQISARQPAQRHLRRLHRHAHRCHPRRLRRRDRRVHHDRIGGR